MSARIREVEHAGLTWFVASAYYASAYAARQAWEHVDRKVPQGSLGLYRHGPTDHQGQVVTVVASSMHEALKASRILRMGEDYGLDDITTEALINRRLRVITELAARNAPAGRLTIRRERGARLEPDGTMPED